jgi:hypothetical protein
MDELDKAGALRRGEARGVVNTMAMLTRKAKVDTGKEIADLSARRRTKPTDIP